MSAPASQVLMQLWEDDERNGQCSLTTFKEELAVVDEGLTLFIEAIQVALNEHENWKNNLKLRASIAMLMHSLNTFLAWRHLLILGYLAESRMFTRSIHESLSGALAFAADESLARNFYQGGGNSPKRIRKAVSESLTYKDVPKQEVWKEFVKLYVRLSKGAHPTLDSFSLRTARRQSGVVALAKAVPEEVVLGGLLQDDLGRVACLGLAQNVVYALGYLRLVLKDATGEWDKRYQIYRSKVESLVEEDETRLADLFDDEKPTS